MKKKLYIVTKYVEAFNIEDALKKEAKTPVESVTISDASYQEIIGLL